MSELIVHGAGDAPGAIGGDDPGLHEVEVRRNGLVAALLALGASAFAVAYLWRAIDAGRLLDWVLFGALGVLALTQLVSLVDARIPLLVADSLGIRIRLGREWRGLRWSALDRVVVERGHGPRDGRLVLEAANLERVLDGLDRHGERQVRAAGKRYGEPLALPLGLSTRVSSRDLAGDLDELAAGRTRVVEDLGRAPQDEPDEARSEAGASPVLPTAVIDHDALEPVRLADTLDDDAAPAEDQDLGRPFAEPGPTDEGPGSWFGDVVDAAPEAEDDVAPAEPDEPGEQRPASGGGDRGTRRMVSRVSAWRARRSEAPVAETGPPRSEGPDLGEVAPLEPVEDLVADVAPAAADEDVEAVVLVTDDDEPPARSGRFTAWGSRVGTLVSRLGNGRSHDVDRPHDEHDADEDETDPRALDDSHAEVTLSTATRWAPVAPPDTPDTPESSTDSDLGPVEEAVAARGGRAATRADIELEGPVQGSVDGVTEDHAAEEPPVAGALVARGGRGVASVVLVDGRHDEVTDPVIGPRLRAARHRMGWSVDELAARTAIRPHLVESMEVDDFAPCGGDFYARGHLRSLAATLGLPGDELVWEFDTLYARPPVDAKQVFSAELASSGISGGLRSADGGPRWGLLVGACVALLLVWSLARTFTDTSVEVTADSPTVEQADLAARQGPITSALSTPRKVTVRVSQPAEVLVDEQGQVIPAPSVKVVVRDRNDAIMFSGRLEPGSRRTLVGLGPFNVKASDGAVVRVTVAGREKGAVSTVGGPGRRTFR